MGGRFEQLPEQRFEADRSLVPGDFNRALDRGMVGCGHVQDWDCELLARKLQSILRLSEVKLSPDIDCLAVLLAVGQRAKSFTLL
jgi:hypothetical protein